MWVYKPVVGVDNTFGTVQIRFCTRGYQPKYIMSIFTGLLKNISYA